MAAEVNHNPTPISVILQGILLTFLAFALPVAEWSVFGWFHVLLPLVAFYQLGKFGTYTGKKVLLIAAVAGSLVFIFYQNYDLLIFSLAMLLTGYVLFLSGQQGDSPAKSGLKGFMTLAGCWAGIFIATSLISGENSYLQLISILDSGITDALDYYRKNNEISAESLLILETTLNQMKSILPVIMASILGSMVLFVVWLTMVVGNRLTRMMQFQANWGHYRLWQLPEKLIWAGIILGLMVILPIPALKAVGINGLILLSVVYMFQGLAITVYFMHKWNVPILLRSFLYVMVFLQSFGTVILLVCGIADIWFDFRRMRKVLPGMNE